MVEPVVNASQCRRRYFRLERYDPGLFVADAVRYFNHAAVRPQDFTKPYASDSGRSARALLLSCRRCEFFDGLEKKRHSTAGGAGQPCAAADLRDQGIAFFCKFTNSAIGFKEARFKAE